jgi:hypothetical protein
MKVIVKSSYDRTGSARHRVTRYKRAFQPRLKAVPDPGGCEQKQQAQQEFKRPLSRLLLACLCKKLNNTKTSYQINPPLWRASLEGYDDDLIA